MGLSEEFELTSQLYSSGSDKTLEDAIIIDAPDQILGVGAEFAYLSHESGQRDVDWTLQSQALTGWMENGRRYDIITVRLRSGEVKES